MSEKYEPRILQLTFGRGKTQRSTEQEGWTKTYYEIREKVVVTSERDLETKWKALESEVDKRLSIPSPLSLTPLDPAQLEKLPWIPYYEGHRAAWIKAEQEGAEKLVEAIKASPDGKLEIGDYPLPFLRKTETIHQPQPNKTKRKPWKRLGTKRTRPQNHRRGWKEADSTMTWRERTHPRVSKAETILFLALQQRDLTNGMTSDRGIC